MLWNGFEHTGPRPPAAAACGCDRGEGGGVERVAGQGPGEVRVASTQSGVEGGGAGHVLLDGQIPELGRAQVEAVR